MRFRVRLDPDAAAPILRALPPTTKRMIRESLRALAEDPSGVSNRLDVRQLDREPKEPHVFRLRMGDWRAVFVVRGAEVLVIRIFPRSDGYGWMERLDLRP